MATPECTPVEIEEWRPVVGFEGSYSVSSLGRVRSEDRVIRGHRHAGRILYVKVTKQDRLQVSISQHSVQVWRYIHALVAAAFVGPRPEGYEINHIDGDHRNNRAPNLEYLPPRENDLHAMRLGLYATGAQNGAYTHPERVLRGPQHPKVTLTAADVRAIRAALEAGEQGQSIARRYGIGATTVSRIKRGEHWGHRTS